MANASNPPQNADRMAYVVRSPDIGVPSVARSAFAIHHI